MKFQSYTVRRCEMSRPVNNTNIHSELRLRKSYFNNLYETSEHAQSLYYVCWLIFAMVAAHAFWLDHTQLTNHLSVTEVIVYAFTPLPYGIACWLALHVFVYALYCGLRVWAQLYCKTNGKGPMRRCLNAVALVIYIALQLGNIGFSATVALKYDFKFALMCGIQMETIRLAMKMHAFVRTSAANVVNAAEGMNTWQGPSLQHYTYYLFAPTLLYRDTYPRWANIRTVRWGRIFWCFAEIGAFIVISALLYSRLMRPFFMDFGRHGPMDYRLFVDAFGYMIPISALLMSVMVYTNMHSTQCIFAELLNFGDRQYHTNWWCSTNFSQFYRRENEVVQNFILEYVYKDIHEFVLCKNTWWTRFVVLTLSAAIHEYIVLLTVRVFLPFVFIFMSSTHFYMDIVEKLPKKIGTCYVLGGTFVGLSILFSVYLMEYFAHQNCPREDTNLLDYLVPHIYTCFVSKLSD